MIEARDVVTLKVPFPNIASNLALKAHMYVCTDKISRKKWMAKCQTFKIGVITGRNALRYFVKEQPNIARNPFRAPTIIDCEKLFTTDKCLPRQLRTISRPDICEELFSDIVKMLAISGYRCHEITDQDFEMLNRYVT